MNLINNLCKDLSKKIEEKVTHKVETSNHGVELFDGKTFRIYKNGSPTKYFINEQMIKGADDSIDSYNELLELSISVITSS